MNILKFDSEAAWVNGVASFWARSVAGESALAHLPAVGAYANPIFAAMGKPWPKGQVSFRDAEIFALDEFDRAGAG